MSMTGTQMFISSTANAIPSGKAPKTRIIHADGRTVEGNHGWEDVRDLPGGTVIEQNVVDDTLPNGPHKKTRRWVAPFTLASREEDYRIAWKHFGKKRDGETQESDEASQ